MSVRDMQEDERRRVADMIRRDQVERGLEAARLALLKSDSDEIIKRPQETWAQFKARADAHASRRRLSAGPLVTPEAEAHGDYEDKVIIHVESYTAVETKRNRITSPIQDMLGRGDFDEDMVRSAEEIEAIICMIRGDVGMRAAFLGMRVDQSRSPINPALENFAMVRAEKAYTTWRDGLPMPRQMFIDMITLPQSLFRTARSYGMGWPKARRLLVVVLKRWPDVKDRVWGALDDEDILAAIASIESGGA